MTEIELDEAQIINPPTPLSWACNERDDAVGDRQKVKDVGRRNRTPSGCDAMSRSGGRA